MKISQRTFIAELSCLFVTFNTKFIGNTLVHCCYNFFSKMNIVEYFNLGKRQPRVEITQKAKKEDCAAPEDAFAEGLQSTENLAIFLKCLQILEQKLIFF